MNTLEKREEQQLNEDILLKMSKAGYRAYIIKTKLYCKKTGVAYRRATENNPEYIGSFEAPGIPYEYLYRCSDGTFYMSIPTDERKSITCMEALEWVGKRMKLGALKDVFGLVSV